MYFCMKNNACAQHDELQDGQLCFYDEDACNASLRERTQVYCLGKATRQYGDRRVHACQRGSLDLCEDGAETFSSLQECFARYPRGKDYREAAGASGARGAAAGQARSRCLLSAEQGEESARGMRREIYGPSESSDGP
jgi:hypothetical protein